MYRRLITFVAVLALLTSISGRASADGTGDAFNGGSDVGASAGDGGGNGGSNSSGGGASQCRYELLTGVNSQAADALFGPAPGTDGAWYRKICDTGNGQSNATVVWLTNPPVDPLALAQEALQRTPIPPPAVHLNPPEGEDQVVNLPTWLWIDPAQWQPVSATASAGAVTVTATASPQSVEWDMGNGDVVTCSGPGTPYDTSKPSSAQSTDCSYTYRKSSASSPSGAFTVRVTVTWDVSWSAVGVAGGGSLGAAEQSTSFLLRVAEIQAVNQ
jgi:hypothetical protein